VVGHNVEIASHRSTLPLGVLETTVDQQNIPIWRCPQNDGCGRQWGSWDEDTTCPFCHCGRGERTGFALGDVARAADEFGFGGDLPVHIAVPVPDLVQLSTLPPDTWIGLPVFHPCGQEGTHANWLLYDVGVVLEVYSDSDFPDELQCRFVTSMGNYTLHYRPSNLWVPRVLAERIV
jgi:hypothetical protein